MSEKKNTTLSCEFRQCLNLKPEINQTEQHSSTQPKTQDLTWFAIGLHSHKTGRGTYSMCVVFVCAKAHTIPPRAPFHFEDESYQLQRQQIVGNLKWKCFPKSNKHLHVISNELNPKTFLPGGFAGFFLPPPPPHGPTLHLRVWEGRLCRLQHQTRMLSQLRDCVWTGGDYCIWGGYVI